MNNQSVKIQVTLEGLRPLMFDRYAGDMQTKLSPEDKMYLDESNHLTMPVPNIYSLLAAENTKSVCRQFFGKNGKTIGLGINAFTNIEPFAIPIYDDKGPIVFNGFDNQMTVVTHTVPLPQISVGYHVARLKGGIPNPKQRPILALPWFLRFRVEYIENSYCVLENLRQAFEFGGIIGLGTFRPTFGRYKLTEWNII